MPAATTTTAGTAPPTTAHRIPSGAGGARRRRRREYLMFLAFVAPNFLFIVVFSYWPVLYNAYLSLTDWDMISPIKNFVGLDNYVDMFTSLGFADVLLTTVYFTVGVVGGSMLLGLGIALLLNLKLRGRTFVRTMVFAPHVLSGAAVGLVWAFIFDPNYGLSRVFFSALGAESPSWLTDSDWALPAVIIVYLWKNTGFAAIVYLAGLQGLPKDVYESAALDGSGPWTTFRRFTLPLLSPVTFFLVVTSTIGSFQAFDVIALTTGGGPGDATTILSWFVYDSGFRSFQAGPAGASSIVMFVILLAITLVQTRYLERKVHYK
ncbi:sn-glycerol 3-phosphate transport system permease protein [Streptosporangium album]|uniref:sn-glycerol 3-phosphate transport system permease protein n=1 Tax=Streptosporangium album TaxID=47479 RepID=A0A7W7S514_9ACTN|nr:sugar ABC transporter permease [Streptosporangium album]MBB4943832.1 sn-glycerol 3-phosphate transport system permease protein [Streptosporangium album]